MSNSTRSGLATSAAGIILLAACLRGPITIVGPLLPLMQSDLGMTDVAAGALSALPLLLFALISLMAPASGNRFGLGRTLGVAVISVVLGILVRSLGSLPALWFGTFLIGTGIAFANVLLPALVKRDFGLKAGGVFAVYAASMAGCGGLAAALAIPVANLPGSDWRWALVMWSVPTAAASALWLPQMLAPSRSDGSGVSSTAPSLRRSPWTHAIGWQVSIFFAMHSLVFYSLVAWFAAYAKSRGMNVGTAGYYLAVYQAVSVITNLACAPLIQRSHSQTQLGFGCGLLFVAGAIGLFLNPPLSLIWLTVLGLGAGIAMTLSLSLFALRTRDHRQAASLSGMAQFIGYLGGASGPLVLGWLLTHTGGWSVPFMMIVAASVLLTVFAVLAGRSRYIE